MCNQCDYKALLDGAGLEATDNRLGVLEVIGNNSYPLSAGNIYTTLERRGSINRVTVYRILDLLVAHGIIDRISTGGRAFYYGMAPSPNHPPHPHFYCTRCGQMDCLTPESLKVDTDTFQKTFPGRIDKIEVRIDGICKNCMK
ncbi:Fur family transcriptional regulator [Desulfosarcina ovata]|uniref:Fur family transcriptional regulator n=2 Tax=Desulfosarcina ovata TaxID=83564 RepID=A0A5K8ACQ8_9BACT|nr:transcriptional repressor [Desulfosarcina ovata]BBO83817.1 Fur family transcriptional regulator [Desulfosarcina ovata subsp. sediminis]BBO90306.1 Fur family transcriptional regulator [Desulfosarcina ovata subsp. ovata]